MNFYLQAFRHPVLRFLLVCLGIVIALWFLTGCASREYIVGFPDATGVKVNAQEAATLLATRYVEYAEPTQTPLVVTATPEPTQQPIATDEVTCPPSYLGSLAVGYIPDPYLGNKKSPIAVDVDCFSISFFGDGWSLYGILAEDGKSLQSCMFSLGEKSYPCVMNIRNVDNLKVYAKYIKPNGREFWICVAKSNQEYTRECQ